MSEHYEAAAIEKIQELVEAAGVKIIKDGGGREFFTRRVEPAKPTAPTAMQLHTLKGLVDMVKAEGLKCAAFITGPRRVLLASELSDDWRQRERYAISEIPDNQFEFGRQMSIENFIINLQCYFKDTEAKKRVIDFVSSIVSSEVKTADDDGISQELVTKQAMAGRKAKVKLDPIVELVPWRTFREVAQPADKFLIRMHRQEENLPTVSLRSAGGDMWEHEAIENIAEYLKKEMPEGIPVIR